MGGRTQVFRPGLIGEVTGHDVTYVDYRSWYPYNGMQPLPYGLPEQIESSDYIEEDICGFVIFEYKGGLENHWNPILNKTPLGLSDKPKKNWTYKILYISEFRWIWERLADFHYNINIKGYIIFESDNYLEEITRDLYEHKENAENLVDRQIAKLLLNAGGYGSFGMKKYSTQIKYINDEDIVMKYLCTGNLLFRNKNIAKINGRVLAPFRNIATAAAITSLARTGMNDLFYKIEKAGFKLIYTDTDSLISTATEEFLKENFKWGPGMGELGYEYEGIKEVVCLGKKLYALWLENGEEVIKLKGINTKKKWDVVKIDYHTRQFINERPLSSETGRAVKYSDFIYLGSDRKNSLIFETFRYRGGKNIWLVADKPTLEYMKPKITIKRMY